MAGLDAPLADRYIEALNNFVRRVKRVVFEHELDDLAHPRLASGNVVSELRKIDRTKNLKLDVTFANTVHRQV